MNEALLESVHGLWDRLADFDAGRPDAALNHLLEGLCELVDAQNANWVAAVRLGELPADDPLAGWRVRVVRYLHPTPTLDEAVRRQMALHEAGHVDPCIVANMAQVGRFRANRLCDLVPPAWFESEYYKLFYLGPGRHDTVWIATPLNRDAESFIGVWRHTGMPRFTEAERDLLAYALRGLKWFQRQLALSHGLPLAGKPLTPVERKVLGGLLSGLAEKGIAAEVGQSRHTTHEYVAAIYRKFGVRNRAALMALWLGKGG
jgi:DNA-binding CsgD family transcriptional regulator